MIIFLFSVAPAIEFCAVPFVWHHATTVGSCFFKSSDNVQQIETYFDIYSCLPVKVIYFSIFFIFLFVFSLENVQLVYKTLKTVFVRFCEHVCVLHHGVVFGLMAGASSSLSLVECFQTMHMHFFGAIYRDRPLIIVA
eukprot:45100_1